MARLVLALLALTAVNSQNPTSDFAAAASLVTTAEEAALTAHGHFTSSNFAAGEAFYLRAYKLFSQKKGAGHFLTKAMLLRLDKLRKLNGNKGPATDADATGVSTPLDISTIVQHGQGICDAAPTTYANGVLGAVQNLRAFVRSGIWYSMSGAVIAVTCDAGYVSSAILGGYVGPHTLTCGYKSAANIQQRLPGDTSTGEYTWIQSSTCILTSSPTASPTSSPTDSPTVSPTAYVPLSTGTHNSRYMLCAGNSAAVASTCGIPTITRVYKDGVPTSTQNLRRHAYSLPPIYEPQATSTSYVRLYGAGESCEACGFTSIQTAADCTAAVAALPSYSVTYNAPALRYISAPGRSSSPYNVAALDSYVGGCYSTRYNDYAGFWGYTFGAKSACSGVGEGGYIPGCANLPVALPSGQ